MKLKLKLTAVIEEAAEGGYVAYIEEIPGVNTQGETLEETKENLFDALQMILEYNRQKADKNLGTRKKGIIKQEYELIAA
jgi:predicted RNase H-like HicB family nuclease